MSTRSGALATVTIALLWAVSAFAAPPQSQYAVSHPSRPMPPKAAVDQGMSLEHECLNAVRATRAAARLPRPAPGDDTKLGTAAMHLDRAETAAHAGHGQLCQDELASAAESLR
jgi:hypothetical protein